MPFDANKPLPDTYCGLTTRTVLYYTPSNFVGMTTKRRRTDEDESTEASPNPDPLEHIPETAIEDEDEVPQDEDEEIAVPDSDFWPTDQELRDIKIAHDNAGHPNGVDFARLLRRGHARPEVAAWVKKHFKCPECEANKRPSARRPAAVPRSYRFNHVVGIDLVKAMNP